MGDFFQEPSHDLLSIRGVDTNEKLVGFDVVDEDVVLDAPLGVAHHRILGGADGDLRDIVGGDILQKPDGAWTGDRDPAHVAHVKKTRLAADGVILVDDPTVLDGHLPSRKVDQLGPGFAMLCDERRLLHGGATGPRAIRRRKSTSHSGESRRRPRATRILSQRGW